ncbi:MULTISPECIES: hypothetical protein [unclassified Empedobacter]|uniref:hypothetical protein n=1 Tax=unclassified Empedobacter TaxID=2643773 RepID=UPI0025B86980|nr:MULTISPECIES: hypothetical protein [unclassified Empedobacter]
MRTIQIASKLAKIWFYLLLILGNLFIIFSVLKGIVETNEKYNTPRIIFNNENDLSSIVVDPNNDISPLVLEDMYIRQRAFEMKYNRKLKVDEYNEFDEDGKKGEILGAVTGAVMMILAYSIPIYFLFISLMRNNKRYLDYLNGNNVEKYSKCMLSK